MLNARGEANGNTKIYIVLDKIYHYIIALNKQLHTFYFKWFHNIEEKYSNENSKIREFNYISNKYDNY